MSAMRTQHSKEAGGGESVLGSEALMLRTMRMSQCTRLVAPAVVSSDSSRFSETAMMVCKTAHRNIRYKQICSRHHRDGGGADDQIGRRNNQIRPLKEALSIRESEDRSA